MGRSGPRLCRPAPGTEGNTSTPDGAANRAYGTQAWPGRKPGPTDAIHTVGLGCANQLAKTGGTGEGTPVSQLAALLQHIWR